MFLAIAMKQLFQKTFIRESRQVVPRLELEQERHCHSPGHPLSRVIFQIPTPAQKTLDHQNFRFSQTVYVSGELNRLARASQGRIRNWRSKNFREAPAFAEVFASPVSDPAL